MTRQERRRQERARQKRRDSVEHMPIPTGPRPWYYRHGYHLGVWSGAAFAVIYFAIFRESIGLVIGIVLGQIAGIFLSRRGRNSGG